MTNQGLRITLPIILSGQSGTGLGILDCYDQHRPDDVVVIYIRKVGSAPGADLVTHSRLDFASDVPEKLLLYSESDRTWIDPYLAWESSLETVTLLRHLSDALRTEVRASYLRLELTPSRAFGFLIVPSSLKLRTSSLRQPERQLSKGAVTWSINKQGKAASMTWQPVEEAGPSVLILESIFVTDEHQRNEIEIFVTWVWPGTDVARIELTTKRTTSRLLFDKWPCKSCRARPNGAITSHKHISWRERLEFVVSRADYAEDANAFVITCASTKSQLAMFLWVVPELCAKWYNSSCGAHSVSRWMRILHRKLDRDSD